MWLLNKYVIDLLIGVVVMALIGFGVHHFIEYEQGIGYNKAVVTYQAAALQQEKLVAIQQAQFTKQIQDANENAIIRQKQIDVLNNSLVVSSHSLRDTTTALGNSLSTASQASNIATASASLKLLSECTARYSDLAEKADRHVSDEMTLIESFPKQNPQP